MAGVLEGSTRHCVRSSDLPSVAQVCTGIVLANVVAATFSRISQLGPARTRAVGLRADLRFGIHLADRVRP